MRQSIFKKQLSETGPNGTIVAEVIATMNFSKREISGTHAATHEDFKKDIGVHKVESFIEGELWMTYETNSEETVYNNSIKLINETRAHIKKLANEPPVKTFAERMTHLFSNY